MMIRIPVPRLAQRAFLAAGAFVLLGTGPAVAQGKQGQQGQQAQQRQQGQHGQKAAAVETPAAQQLPEYRFDFSLFGGGHFFTKDHPLGRSKGDPTDVSPSDSGMFGGILGMHLTPWISIEGEVAAIPSRTRNDATSLWVFGYRGSFVLHVPGRYQFQPFILAGYGGLTSLSGDSSVVHGDTWGF